MSRGRVLRWLLYPLPGATCAYLSRRCSTWYIPTSGRRWPARLAQTAWRGIRWLERFLCSRSKCTSGSALGGRARCLALLQWHCCRCRGCCKNLGRRSGRRGDMRLRLGKRKECTTVPATKGARWIREEKRLKKPPKMQGLQGVGAVILRKQGERGEMNPCHPFAR